MKDRPAQHDTFVIERIFAAPRERVFAAWSTVAAKRQWFYGPPGWQEAERAFDFRVGGRERLVGVWTDGHRSVFDATFLDIVPGERLVYTYAMHIDERLISISLATVEFRHASRGTTMVFTEQAAFLDGFADGGGRERGTRTLFEQMERALSQEGTPAR